MRLQARLTLAFLGLVGLLMGLSTWALYERINAQFRRDFEARVTLTQDAVRQRVRLEARALRERVSALAKAPALVEAAQDLRHGRFDTAARRRLAQSVAALRRSAHLDALWVLDSGVLDSGRLDSGRDGSVLAAPHRLGDQTLPESLARYLKRGGRGHVIVEEAVERSGRSLVLPVLEVLALAADGRFVVVGGEVIGRYVAEDLAVGAFEDTHATVQGASGRVVADTYGGAGGPSPVLSGYETARVVMRNAGDEVPALVVTVYLSRRRLTERLESLFRASAFISGTAGLLALLLGWLIARWITRPLNILLDATRRVAAGDRSVELPVGRRDEVGELMDAFSNMTHEVEESEGRLRRAERVAAWQDIARELAHEIKNPLTPIQMAIETVRRTWQRKHPRFEEVFEEATATILEEVARLKNIVSEFSQFARMPRPNPQLCALNELVHQAVVLYREEADVRVEETLDGRLGPQLLDPDRLTQVLQNLLKNGIQATRAVDRDGLVTIETALSEDGTQVTVSVTDNGCGIPDKDLARVFTPYFTSKAGGTGLGLAVVHRIVDGHGGRLGVSSRVGAGTRFSVELPYDVESAPR